MNIVVIGMGYVGIPCAALLADVPGFTVTGVQRRSERSGWKIDCLNEGRSPFEGNEPGLGELLDRVVCAKQTFHVTDDPGVCREADAILIDVQTPTDDEHVPQYESLREVSDQAGRYLRAGALVIVESTVAPGTTRGVVQPILENASGLKASGGNGGRERLYLAFSYERVMPGKLLEYITDFPRVVGGVDEESTRRAVELYRHIVRATITPTDVLTAEMAKVVENAYRDVNIAFANEMALACERMGVDVFTVQELVNARPDRQMHVAGAGVGGHCLPKDGWLLNYGLKAFGAHASRDTSALPLHLVPLARRVNDGMPEHMAALVEASLAQAGISLDGARVAVLGVAYLEESDDTRNTPALPLIRALRARGADVVAHDPYVRQQDWQLLWQGNPPLPLLHDLDAALEGVDCAALVTRHSEYASFLEKAGAMRTRAVVDGRNMLDQEACRGAGYAYRGVGKGRFLRGE